MKKPRQSPQPSAYVVLKKDNHLVFHRRNDLDILLNPSQKTEEKESFTQMLCREIREELGIDLEPGDAEIVHVKRRGAKDGSWMDFFYTASAWDGVWNASSSTST